jgi:hypothetical protein
MNYAQATNLGTALLAARLAADAAAAHIANARDIAQRAGESKKSETGADYGFAVALEFVAGKASNFAKLAAHVQGMLEQRLAADGDAVAAAAIARREQLKAEAERQIGTAALKADRKRRALREGMRKEGARRKREGNADHADRSRKASPNASR